jgi:hypothetical protein
MEIQGVYQPLVHDGEIWRKSRCLQHEDAINQQIFDCLKAQGFNPTDHFRIWNRGDQRVIVCLVDDLLSCSQDYHSDLPYIFDSNTTVITDNRVLCPTLYRVIQVPESFFGIYSYVPEPQEWKPDRLFAFNINRIDHRRVSLLLDLAWRISLDLGYVNFNCQKRSGIPGKTQQSLASLEEFWKEMGDQTHQKFQTVYEKLSTKLPLINYDINFELVPLRSFINIVVESYSSDNNISLSEKIFRALVTPSPWTVYSGRYTVAYLESLGFDCMRDLVGHNHYDRLKEIEEKTRIFNWKSLEVAKALQLNDIETVKERCQQASLHNQKILADMSQRWNTEFPNWLDTLPSLLAREPSLR